MGGPQGRLPAQPSDSIIIGMTIAQAFLAEFEQEMGSTRKMLESVPDEFLDFRPHPKSMTMGQLAGHVAEMPAWGVSTVSLTELDIRPADGPKFVPFVPASKAELLDAFDGNVAKATEAVADVGDDAMQVAWTLLAGGQPLFSMPRIQVLKSMVLNHIIHHRAQLSVYLRLKDVQFPGMYGPTADDHQPV